MASNQRRKKWPVVVGLIAMIVSYMAFGMLTEDSEERRHRIQWENTLVPCYVDPRTGEYRHVPCMSGSEVKRS